MAAGGHDPSKRPDLLISLFTQCVHKVCPVCPDRGRQRSLSPRRTKSNRDAEPSHWQLLQCAKRWSRCSALYCRKHGLSAERAGPAAAGITRRSVVGAAALTVAQDFRDTHGRRSTHGEDPARGASSDYLRGNASMPFICTQLVSATAVCRAWHGVAFEVLLGDTAASRPRK